MSKSGKKHNVLTLFLSTVILLLISTPAYAIDLKEINNPLIEVFLIISFLSFVPAVLIMFTSFTRIVIVMSFLRHAFGGAQVPPNMVVIGLSLFLTFFIMSPTINAVTEGAITPYIQEEMSFSESIENAVPPLKDFMLKQTRQKDIALFAGLAKQDLPESPADLSLSVLVPAFAISELKTAFEIGFLLFLPFLIIDMVIASILLSMGMMMLPPVMISLPFKLLMFVLVDGWNLIIGSIMRTF
ncbi:MAG: flagellar biosynthesis protein flip [Nitrospira bacterium SG8_35_1]|nr:MAG: flagellar biosynthesis protein flip [Nitrospira bacterium SG8_35_1]UCE71985.1 MAG: flagellar type III secretion system pore protein FliP [Nitrospiraceae bacterium]